MEKLKAGRSDEKKLHLNWLLKEEEFSDQGKKCVDKRGKQSTWKASGNEKKTLNMAGKQSMQEEEKMKLNVEGYVMNYVGFYLNWRILSRAMIWLDLHFRKLSLMASVENESIWEMIKVEKGLYR